MKTAIIGLGLWAALCGAALARDFTSTVTESDHIEKLRPEFQTPDDANQLFYVQRSSNSNTVVYAAHLDSRGEIDMSDPIEAFWRKFNIDGGKVGLNLVERMMAYGVRVDRAQPGQPVTFTIAALPERKLTLTLDARHKPEALMQVGNRNVKLAYVYLHVIEGGLMPKVPELDILGTDTATGKAVHEHLVLK